MARRSVVGETLGPIQKQQRVAWLLGGRSVSRVAPAVVVAFPLYTIPLAFLFLSFSLSLLPVSPALPFPLPSLLSMS